MRIRQIISFGLIASGAVLLFLGARDLFESRLGQTSAARQFEKARESAHTREWPGSTSPAPERIQPPKAGDTIAKLTIPRLDADLYVVEGDDAADLRRAPGHLIGTAMPGQDGNCIIAGHRDTHFRVLKDIRKGDDIVLQTPTGQYLYRVKRTEVISPRNTKVLQPTSDAELNLITCYPFYYIGSAPKRFIVQAELAGAVVEPAS
jgi:sortase A